MPDAEAGWIQRSAFVAPACSHHQRVHFVTHCCVSPSVSLLLPSVTLPFGPSAKGGRPPAVAALELLVNRYLHPLHHGAVIFSVNRSNALSCFFIVQYVRPWSLSTRTLKGRISCRCLQLLPLFIAIHHSLHLSPCRPQPRLFSFNVCCGLAGSIVQDKHART